MSKTEQQLQDIHISIPFFPPTISRFIYASKRNGGEEKNYEFIADSSDEVPFEMQMHQHLNRGKKWLLPQTDFKQLTSRMKHRLDDWNNILHH